LNTDNRQPTTDNQTPSPAPTPQSSLGDWLRYLETLHPRAIDLGLDRVCEVWRRLGSPRPAPVCVVVGGTNGKGSTVAFLSAMLAAAGYRVGSYTSPHLLRYNERVRVVDSDASDAQLVAAFAAIDTARGDISLSYFEFGTLAAFLILAQARLDVAVLEIGLGGRLDAVNLIDGDAAILTSVDLDHQDYLGPDRERIGWDKAHIFRRGRPAIVAAVNAPASVHAVAHEIGAYIHLLPPLAPAREAGWICPLPDGKTLDLPLPRLEAPSQLRNAAAAICAWWLLGQRLPFSGPAVRIGVATAHLRGRLERLPRVVETWVDVAHNPEAARELAGWLRRAPERRNVGVFAALADKDLAGIVGPLADGFCAWIVVDLRAMTPRAADPDEQSTALRQLLPRDVPVFASPGMLAALAAADDIAGADGRVLVFGSFFTVAAALGVVA
jgi:dihydrofolate synthase/folylpolyglutamate synthase